MTIRTIRASALALTAICSSVLFIESVSLAQPTVAGKTAPANGANAAVQADPSPTARPPNLAVVALTSDPQCNVKVTIKNEGGFIPQNQPAIQYTVTRANPATPETPQSIPAAQLSSPGSTVTVIYPNLKTTATAQSFTARVSSSTRDHRAEADGRTVTHNLTCGNTLPDLSMSVAYEADCSRTITFKNTGGELPDAVRDVAVGVDRITDGWTYTGFASTFGIGSGRHYSFHDPVRAYESSQYKAFAHEHRPLARDGGAGIALSNSDPVPQRCRGPKPNFQLTMSNVGVDPQSCKAFVTVLNQGAPLPPTFNFDVAFARDTGGTSTTHSEAGSGMQTNAKQDVFLGQALTAAPVNFKISLLLPTGNVGPKVITLNCPTAH